MARIIENNFLGIMMWFLTFEYVIDFFFVEMYFSALKPYQYILKILSEHGQSQYRLVFSRLLDLRGNLGIVKEKPTRITCFSREMKRLARRIYQAKFCLSTFL